MNERARVRAIISKAGHIRLETDDGRLLENSGLLTRGIGTQHVQVSIEVADQMFMSEPPWVEITLRVPLEVEQ